MQSFYTTRVLQKRSEITAFDHIRKSLFQSVFKSGELEIMDILIGVEVFCPINPLPSDDQVFKNQTPDGTSWMEDVSTKWYQLFCSPWKPHRTSGSPRILGAAMVIFWKVIPTRSPRFEWGKCHPPNPSKSSPPSPPSPPS